MTSRHHVAKRRVGSNRAYGENVPRQPEAAMTSPSVSDRPLVAATAVVGVFWAFVVLGVGTVRSYDAWALHRSFMRSIGLPGANHWSGPGRGLLPVLSALDFLVLIPLTLLWIVLALVVFASGRRGPGRLHLAVVVVVVGLWILLSVARGAASPPSDPSRAVLFTPAIDFSMLVAADGLAALVASVWFWRRASR